VVDNVYTIFIDDTTNPALKTFTVYDDAKNQIIIENCPNLHGEEDTPIFEGIKLLVIDEDGVAFDASKTGWFTEAGDTSDCNWEISASPTSAYPYFYEVRFNAIGDTAFFPPTMVLPFQVWNVTLNQQADIGVFDPNPADTTQDMKDGWTSGDIMKLKEMIDGRVKFTWVVTLTHVPGTIDTTINEVDTTITDPTWIEIPPQQGDVAKIFSTIPLTSLDSYTLSTQSANTSSATEKDLDKITVIPNPYAITSSYETKPWIKELQFHNLPEECEIRIFTISGDLIQILHHEPNSDGYRGPAVEAWNLWTYNDQEVAFGVYIFHIKAEGIGEKLGKFAIIK